ncbi:unnamed protein product [Cochlearia groenlandica]
MLTLNDLPGVFDDELEAEYLAEDEEEGRAADLEAVLPSSPRNSPSLPITSTPPANIPPPSGCTPPLPAGTYGQRSSTPPRVKKAREVTEGGSNGLPQAKRVRTEAMPAEAEVCLDGARIEEMRADGLRHEETGPSRAAGTEGENLALPAVRAVDPA